MNKICYDAHSNKFAVDRPQLESDLMAVMNKYELQYIAEVYWVKDFNEEIKDNKSSFIEAVELVEEPAHLSGDFIFEKIESHPFKSRTLNILKKANIQYIGELAQMSIDKLLELPGCGKTSIDDIHSILLTHGVLPLGTKLHKWKSRLKKHLKDNKGKK